MDFNVVYGKDIWECIFLGSKKFEDELRFNDKCFGKFDIEDFCKYGNEKWGEFIMNDVW